MKDMPNNLPEDTAGKQEGFRLFSDVFKWSMNTEASSYDLGGKNGEKKKSLGHLHYFDFSST